MKIEIDKKDLENLISRLEEGSIEDVIYKGMEGLANYGLGVVKKNTPVATGQLRRGWYIARLNSTRALLKNPISYAEYVEYGHIQNVGQYVPKLGKRLKAAWVPGVFFAQKSEEIIRKHADNIIRPIIIEELEKMIND